MSPSSKRLFQLCPRKFRFRYVLGIEPKQKPSVQLQFGTAFAKAIEHNVNKPVADWSVCEAAAGLDTDLSCQLAGAVAAYAIYWAGSVTYRAAELELVTPLRNPRLTYVTVLDGLVEQPNGVLAVIDEKTTTQTISPGSWFFEKLSLDDQVSGYIWAARKHGYAVEHAVWDAIKRPTMPRRDADIEPEHYVKSGKWGNAGDLKPGTGIPAETPAEYAKRIRDTMLENPTTYFQRQEIVRMDDELEAALEDVEMVGEQILSCWDSDKFPRNPSACFNRGERCGYFEVCSGSASPADEQLYTLRAKR